MAEQMVKVIFKNGYHGALRPVIASRMVKKNQCIYAKDAPKKETKPKAKVAEPKEDNSKGKDKE
jgi:hypothetical protein